MGVFALHIDLLALETGRAVCVSSSSPNGGHGRACSRKVWTFLRDMGVFALEAGAILWVSSIALLSRRCLRNIGVFA